MEFDERSVRLKDGRAAVLRAPRIEDAAALIEYLKTITGETPFLSQGPDEVQITLEQEEDFLRGHINAPRGAMIVAEIDGEIAGCCTFAGVSAKRRFAHRCVFETALYQKYCGLGLGYKLMEYALEMAKDCGYEQIELEVVAGNDRAIALYESVGFEAICVHPCGLKYDDGSYAGVVQMMKEL